MKRIPASVCVILAAVGWGIIGFFTRNLSALGLSVLQLTCARAFVTLFGSALILLIGDRKAFRIALKDLWMFAVTGIVSIVFFNMCYFYTIEITTLSVAAILLYTAPSFVVVMSAVLFKDKITKNILLALILSTVGCIFTTGISSGSLSVSGIGILTGIGSGFFYAIYSIMGTVILKKYTTPTLVFYTFVFATLGLLPFSNPTVFFSYFLIPRALVHILLIGIISTLLPYFFYSEGLSRMEPGRASILAFAEPMTATLVGIMVFHEGLNWQNGLGILLIFISIIILSKKS